MYFTLKASKREFVVLKETASSVTVRYRYGKDHFVLDPKDLEASSDWKRTLVEETPSYAVEFVPDVPYYPGGIV